MNGQLTIFRIWIHACAIKSAFWYPKTLERWLNGNTFYIEKLQSKTKIMAKNFIKFRQCLLTVYFKYSLWLKICWKEVSKNAQTIKENSRLVI